MMGMIRQFMFVAVIPLMVWPYFVELPGSDNEAAGLSEIEELIGARTNAFDRLTAAVFGTGDSTRSGDASSGGGGGGGGSVMALSYSLWGSKVRYTWGMVVAAKLAPSAFPGWKVHIYHDHTVPSAILTELSDMSHVRLIDVEKDLPGWVHKDLNPMSWRFLIASDPSVSVYGVRDGDSRPTVREKAAVDEWLRSGRSFHIMRDHPMHNPVNFAPMLGGMWGGLHRAVPHMDRLLQDYYGTAKEIRYAEDQNFLWQNILPLAAKDCMQHDSYYCGESGAIAFPMTRAEAGTPYDFVGQVYQFDERDERADPRLSLPEYIDRYEVCNYIRGMRMDQLKATTNDATAIPTTFYKGSLNGTSTDVWDKWVGAGGKPRNPPKVVKSSAKLTQLLPPKKQKPKTDQVVTLPRNQEKVRIPR